MQWGVELVREGDRLEQHSGRFSQSGSYASTLLLSDYIILEFRNTRPEHPHPSRCNIYPSIHSLFFELTLHKDIPNLYHVVFSKDYQEVIILDCFPQPVPGGPIVSLVHQRWRKEAFGPHIILSIVSSSQHRTNTIIFYHILALEVEQSRANT